MGNGLMLFMLVQYVAIGAVFAWEKDWGRAIYFAGAVVINLGVLVSK